MLVLVLTAASAHADVRVTRRSQFTSDDPAFRRLPKEVFSGLEQTVIVKGERMMTINGPNVAEIVDLGEERIYALDLRRRTYSVRTFAQVRDERLRLDQETEKMKADLEELMRKSREAEARARREQEERARSRGGRPQPPEPQVVKKTEEERMREFVQNYEHTSKPTGQRRTILGFDAQEVVSTTRIGPTDDVPFGMVVSVTQWLAEMPELREIDAFETRYRAATGETAPPPSSAYLDMSAMTAAMQAHPLYADMMKRVEVDDSVKGTPLSTTMRMEPAVGADAAGTPSAPKGGGLLGRIGEQAGRSLGLPRRGRRDDSRDARPMPPMTTRQEIVAFSRMVTDAEVAIPAGFREVSSRGR
jgi:hypothetical protein